MTTDKDMSDPNNFKDFVDKSIAEAVGRDWLDEILREVAAQPYKTNDAVAQARAAIQAHIAEIIGDDEEYAKDFYRDDYVITEAQNNLRNEQRKRAGL
jgi:hypothetical protein